MCGTEVLGESMWINCVIEAIQDREAVYVVLYIVQNIQDAGTKVNTAM